MQETDYDQLRKSMVEYQLKRNGIQSKEVLEAFLSVYRHIFVPIELREKAYENHPLPIGFEQTISQPYIVAYMIEQLNLKKNMRVLEIGTGSGYQTAILSCLCKEVYSVEIYASLAKQAKEILTKNGFKNIKLKIDDGYNGWKAHAPFDRIIVSCAPVSIPPTLTEQLAEGGKMIIPAGTCFAQKLYLVENKSGTLTQTESLPVSFVPMIPKR